MKTITPAVELFTFEELSEKVQERALNDLINAWLANEWFVPEEALPRFKKAVQRSFDMQTPWFAAEMVYDACKTYIEDELDRWYYEANGKNYDYIEFVDEEYEDVCE